MEVFPIQIIAIHKMRLLYIKVVLLNQCIYIIEMFPNIYLINEGTHPRTGAKY